MTRKKVKLAFITNDSSRKATFKKRKKGLMKKVSELTTLCGIEACTIIYSPYNNEFQPDVWPHTMGVQRVLARFKRMSEMEQNKKMVNQESFIRQRIEKSKEQLKKQMKENREKEIKELMYQCLVGKGIQNLGMVDLSDLGSLVDQNLKEIYKRIESLVKKVSPLGTSVSEEEKKPIVDFAMDVVQRPQWFTDWMINNNPNENMGFGGYEIMMMPFGDHNHNHNAMWSSAFFPQF